MLRNKRSICLASRLDCLRIASCGYRSMLSGALVHASQGQKHHVSFHGEKRRFSKHNLSEDAPGGPSYPEAANGVRPTGRVQKLRPRHFYDARFHVS